jgi:microcystin-dependent protein
MASDRRTRRDIEERVIKITEVNMSKRQITGIDQHGTRQAASLHFLDPLVSIPARGEQWTAVRRGNDWYLNKRIETGNERTRLSSLNPGDRRLDAPGTLHLGGQEVWINGEEIEDLIIRIILDIAVPIGSLFPTLRSTAPTNFLMCDGDQYAINSYPDLYTIVGTDYNLGTEILGYFRVPDYRDMFLLGKGLDTELGDTGGIKEHPLTVGELPSFVSTIVQSGTGATVAGVPSGTGSAHENMPPYKVVNYIIKAV